MCLCARVCAEKRTRSSEADRPLAPRPRLAHASPGSWPRGAGRSSDPASRARAPSSRQSRPPTRCSCRRCGHWKTGAVGAPDATPLQLFLSPASKSTAARGAASGSGGGDAAEPRHIRAALRIIGEVLRRKWRRGQTSAAAMMRALFARWDPRTRRRRLRRTKTRLRRALVVDVHEQLKEGTNWRFRGSAAHRQRCDLHTDFEGHRQQRPRSRHSERLGEACLLEAEPHFVFRNACASHGRDRWVRMR